MTTQPNQFSLKDYFVEILRNGQKINEPQQPQVQQQNPQALANQRNNSQPLFQSFGAPANSGYNPMRGQSQVQGNGEKIGSIFAAILKGGM